MIENMIIVITTLFLVLFCYWLETLFCLSIDWKAFFMLILLRSSSHAFGWSRNIFFLPAHAALNPPPLPPPTLPLPLSWLPSSSRCPHPPRPPAEGSNVLWDQASSFASVWKHCSTNQWIKTDPISTLHRKGRALNAIAWTNTNHCWLTAIWVERWTEEYINNRLFTSIPASLTWVFLRVHWI